MYLRRLFLTGWALIGFLTTFSQNQQDKKHDFVYKSVNGHNIMATIYLPDTDEDPPVLVYFHGGGFMFGNRDQGLEQVLKEKLLAAKIAVISADYRLAPESKLEEIISDVDDIVGWVKINGHEKFNVNPNKIAVAGGSAGGYLALSTGFEPGQAPDAIVTISAPTGFSTAGMQTGDLSLLKNIKKDTIVSHGDYSTRMALWRYLGKNGLALYEIFGFDPVKESEKLDRYTLTNNIKSGYPPTLIIHSKNDRFVKLEEAEAFHTFLQDKNIPVELYVVENGHSSTLIAQHPEVIDEIILFLEKAFEKSK